MSQRMVDRMMDAMVSGKPWDMAVASWSYSRAHGLSVWAAFVGAAELYVRYWRKTK